MEKLQRWTILSACYKLFAVMSIPPSKSAPILSTNRRVPVEGVSFSITCTLDASITSTVRFYKGVIHVQGGCSSSGSCSSPVSGYSVSLDTTSRILTLDIASPDSTRDSGTWRCTVGTTVSNMITLSQFDAVLDWSSVTFSPQLTSLPSSVTPQNTISVTVTTPCAAPAAVITWRYQQGVSGVPPSSTSSSQGSCPSGQVQTTNTLSLPGNTASLYNRQVSLTVSVEHDSFDPPMYTKSVTSNIIHFPVPVTSVTLTNNSSDHVTIGLAIGQSLTLICVTSASFPTSNVTWVTLPSGTTPTVSTETTSGVLVKTTSSITFTVSRTDQGKSIHCQAENINGQTSPQSNRATLEVWYPPDKPNITNPGTLCEGKCTSLTCSSSPYPGNPPATFYWTKNNATIHTGSSYTFSPVKADNEAAIRCAAGNNYTDRAGSSRPQSDARQLSVYYMGVPTITPAATQTRKEGQSLSLTCSANGNTDNAVISWTFNNSTIPGSSVMKADLNRSDDGEYVCTGRVNTSSVCPGLQKTSNVTVIVNYAPDITFSPVNTTEGQPLTLKCEARGRPATYTFRSFIQYWGNTSVDSRAGTPSGGDYTWSVGAATYLDTGVYECSVDNTVSDRNDVLVQRKRVSVNVRARPKFTDDSGQRFGAEVGTNTTVVQSFYNSDLNYTSYNWTFGQLDTPVNRPGSVRSSQVTLRKNNKEVQHAGFSVSLEIQNFQEQDIGVYTVTVCNVVGCSSSQVNLTAAGPPLAPLEFKAVNTTETSVLLRWKSNYPGGDYTQTFLLYYRVEKSGEWTTRECEDNPRGYVYADITGLQSGTRYEFKVMAMNTREQDNEGPFTQVESQETKSPRPPDKDSYTGVAAGAGVGGAVLILAVIGVTVLLVKRRRQHDEDTEKHLMRSSGSQKKRRCRNEHEMRENDIYEGGAAAAAAAAGGGGGGDVYSQVIKPKKTVKKDDEAVYAKPSKEKKTKKEKDKDLERPKVMQDEGGAAAAAAAPPPPAPPPPAAGDAHSLVVKPKKPDAEKKNKNMKKKRDDKIPLKPKKPKQARSDVYENTVPGQFGNGTYANAGYVADDGDAATKGQQSGRDEDGLLYVSLDFGNARPSTEVHRAEEPTEYAGIAFGQVGPPPPPDEEAEDEKKK